MSVVSRGTDTTVSIDYPNLPVKGSGTSAWLRAKASAKRPLVHFPLPDIRGATVLSAELTGHVRGTWASQTVSFSRLTENWSPSTATWNNQPTAAGVSASVLTGVLHDGDEFVLDATHGLQAVANGEKWYGIRINTDSTADNLLYGFDSSRPSWTLTYELSQAPHQPVGLVPDGGVVGAYQPTLSWDIGDFGGVDNQAAFRVQIDPLGDLGGTPDFDSGVVISTEAMFDTTTALARTVTFNRVNGSKTLTAALGMFEDSDKGMSIVGTGIPVNAIVAAVPTPTTATLSLAAVGTATGSTATLTRLYPGPVLP